MLVILLIMTGIRSFLQKLHNTVIPPTAVTVRAPPSQFLSQWCIPRGRSRIVIVQHISAVGKHCGVENIARWECRGVATPPPPRSTTETNICDNYNPSVVPAHSLYSVSISAWHLISRCMHYNNGGQPEHHQTGNDCICKYGELTWYEMEVGFSAMACLGITWHEPQKIAEIASKFPSHTAFKSTILCMPDII